jgi:hypothetical protein
MTMVAPPLRGKDTPNHMSLAGDWTVSLDSPSAPSAAMQLPGTTDLAGLGTPLALEPEMSKQVLKGLHRRHHFVGKAYYRKTIHIPRDWAGSRIVLFLERVLWTSTVLLNDQPLSTCNSLSAPHTHVLPDDLAPGDHELNICVDNTPHVDVGMPHAYTEETQSIWNGVVGAIELRRTSRVRIDRLVPRFDRARRELNLDVELINELSPPLAGTISVELHFGNTCLGVSSCVAQSSKVRSRHQLCLPLPDNTPLWDEFDPQLLELRATLKTTEPDQVVDSMSQRIGLREFATDGAKLLINGRPVFLRGTLECAVFPLTGHPHMSADGWREIFESARDHGLNHLRFHSWTPPEAAFEVADEMGFYLQVELPYWSTSPLVVDNASYAFFQAEGRRILDSFGHHPSLVIFALGNELHGPGDVLDQLVRELRAHDDRPLFTSTSFSFTPRGMWPGKEDAIFISQQTRKGWVRGQGFFNSESPATSADFSAGTEGLPCPIVAHEVGQYTVYPNLSEISKYEGALHPLNLIAIQNDVERKGLLSQVAKFVSATGAFAARLYREDIERSMRTPDFAGIQLLGLNDFPGQSTALIGLVDSFWQSKGVLDPDEMRRFCAPVVPLLRMPRRLWKTSDTFTADVQIANFGKSVIDRATVRWSILRGDMIVAQGRFDGARIELGNRNFVGQIALPLEQFKDASELQVRVWIAGTSADNVWSAWVYPDDAKDASPGNVLVTRLLDDAARAHLNQGGSVLLSPSLGAMKNAIRARFLPVFWSPLHFPSQPGTMGILCDPSHPALAQFPTSFHSDWQWQPLTSVSAGIDVSHLPVAVKPIVQFIDNFNRNAVPAAVFEVRVGAGKLMISTLDLLGDGPNRQVADQLRFSLLQYMNSSAFEPLAKLEVSHVESLFSFDDPMSRARIHSCTSEQPGHEASAMLDGDNGTLWHSNWGADDQYPHEFVVDLDQRLPMTGVAITPRPGAKDKGHIQQFAVYTSDDGSNWSPAVTGSLPMDTVEQQIEFAPAYDAAGVYLGTTRTARFIRFVALSSHDGSPFAALRRFRAIPAVDA